MKNKRQAMKTKKTQEQRNLATENLQCSSYDKLENKVQEYLQFPHLLG